MMWQGNALATPDGHANLRFWCMAPHEALLADSCIVSKNLTLYADILFADLAQSLNEKDEVFGHIAEGRVDYTRKFCRSQGLCDDTVLNVHSSLADSEAFCDQKYGHLAWTQITMPESEKEYSMTEIGQHFCAQGRFHCEANFCKKYMCGDEKQDAWEYFRSLNVSVSQHQKDMENAVSHGFATDV